MGYLHMTGRSSRLEELIDWCIQQVEEGRKQWKISESGFLMQRWRIKQSTSWLCSHSPLQSHQWLLWRKKSNNRARKTINFLIWAVKKRLPPMLEHWHHTWSMERRSPSSHQKCIRLLPHLHSTAEGTASFWLEMIPALAHNFRATLQLSGQDYVSILDRLPYHGPIFKDTSLCHGVWYLIQYSFIYLGRASMDSRATESKDGKVSPVIRAEQAVFRAWIQEGHQGVYRFSQLYLWGIEQADLDFTQIKASLHQLIEDQKINCKTSLLLFGTMGQSNQGLPNSISNVIRSNIRLISGRSWRVFSWKSDRSSPVLSFSFTRCDLNGINPEFCATCTAKLFSFVRLAIDL